MLVQRKYIQEDPFQFSFTDEDVPTCFDTESREKTGFLHRRKQRHRSASQQLQS